MLIGSVDCKIIYFCLTAPITLSTCILTCDSCLEISTSSLLSWGFPLVKGGCLTSAHSQPTFCSIVNPQSASMTSPGKRWRIRPLFSVKCTSDTLPPQPFKMKETDPCGVIPIKNLAVLCFLYVWARAWAFNEYLKTIYYHCTTSKSFSKHHWHSFQQIFPVWPINEHVQLCIQYIKPLAEISTHCWGVNIKLIA